MRKYLLVLNFVLLLTSCSKSTQNTGYGDDGLDPSQDQETDKVTNEKKDEIEIPAVDDNLVVENSENIEIHNPAYLRAEGTREIYLTAALKAVLDVQGGKAILNFLEKGEAAAIQDLSFDVYNSESFFLQLYFVGDQSILLKNWDPNFPLSYYFFDGTAWTKLPLTEKIEKYLSENYSGYRTNSFWSSAQDIVGEIPGSIDISVSFNPTPSTPPQTLSVSFDPKTDEVKPSTRRGY